MTAETHKKPGLETLRATIRRLEGHSDRRRTVLPFGVREIDARLPGGGLALGALHEVAGGGNDALHSAAAGQFCAGIAARTRGKVLWIVTRQDVFAPSLKQVGLSARRWAPTSRKMSGMMKPMRHRQAFTACPSLSSTVPTLFQARSRKPNC